MPMPEENCVEQRKLTAQQVDRLRRVFDRCSAAQQQGAAALSLDGFCLMAEELDLPSAQLAIDQQQQAFHDILAYCSRGAGSVEFEAFCGWAAAGRDADSVALLAQLENDAAPLWGAVTRACTAMTRPLANMVSQSAAATGAKASHMSALLVKKFAVFLKSAMQNPSRLFKRKAMSPLEVFKAHPEGVAAALRSEFGSGGIRGITSHFIGPVLANSVVSIAMFHTYATTKSMLSMRAEQQDLPPLTPLRIEMLAGGAAGVVQGTLNAPLYNVKLRQLRRQGLTPQKFGIFEGGIRFYQSRGLLAFYRNYPFIIAQEGCSLALFFGSYQFFKTHLTQATRQHIDPSGGKDLYAWAFAASAAGVVLAGVGTPFENVLEWHVARRDSSANQPRSVLGHWWHCARPGSHRRILLSGMRKKLPLAPLVGLPLLVYEALLHSGAVPVLHSTDE